MLSRIVGAIDKKLRASHGVMEYSNSPHCIFRVELSGSIENVTLADGTAVRPGDRIVALHLWNEHVPPFPPHGPTLGWARRLSRALETSLRELDFWLASRADLDDIRAIRADMSLGARERTRQLWAMAARYGFEATEPAKRSIATLLHRFGENILIAMLVLVHNPASFRANTFRRCCAPIFLSRATLRERFRESSAGGRLEAPERDRVA